MIKRELFVLVDEEKGKLLADHRIGCNICVFTQEKDAYKFLFTAVPDEYQSRWKVCSMEGIIETKFVVESPTYTEGRILDLDT